MSLINYHVHLLKPKGAVVPIYDSATLEETDDSYLFTTMSLDTIRIPIRNICYLQSSPTNKEEIFAAVDRQQQQQQIDSPIDGAKTEEIDHSILEKEELELEDSSLIDEFKEGAEILYGEEKVEDIISREIDRKIPDEDYEN
tara:strand:- start:32122 stop:32547 length:426 start_codon:yes stop_codon:yes gene_type:complete